MDLCVFVMFGDFGRFLEIFRILHEVPSTIEKNLNLGQKCIVSRFSVSLSNLVAGVLEIHGFVFFRDVWRCWKVFGNIQNVAPRKY